MRLAKSADGLTFGEPKVVSTPVDQAELVRVFTQTAQELLGEEKPVAVAGGLSRRFQTLIPELQNSFTCPVYLENDAALAALGEAHAGAGRNYNIVAYLTISTGVGGARIVKGKIDEKVSGFEPGKQFIHVPMKPAGHLTTLEDAVSGTSLAKKFSKPAREIADQEVWAELARILAYGLHNTIMHWSPSVVVLGGSMITGTPSIDLNAISENLKQISSVFPELPVLKVAELADFGGLHGALHFLQEKLSK